jgi:hypothetical protein
MRWRFTEDLGAAEIESRRVMIDLIDRWWHEFADRTEDLNAMFTGGQAFDLPAWMSDHLGAIHPELMWEYGPAVHGPGHRLVITPESRYHLAPLVDEILAQAPQLAGWEFYPHRLRESLEHAEATVNARTGGTLRDVAVAVSTGNHHLIDLEFVASGVRAEHDAFVATEALLGEATLNTWIGEITTTSPKRRLGLRRGRDAPGKRVPIADLANAVEQQQHSILSGVAARPHAEWPEDGTEWSLFQLTAAQDDDYPGRADLVTGLTIDPALWKASLAGRFHSSRFTRSSETFCYVKIDGIDGLTGSEFDDRGAIEDALDRMLRADGFGCVIGAGTGLRYSYVDLALTDLDAGLSATRARLAQGGLPRRSWIQFLDMEWSHEWIGIHPDTPAPPVR